MLLDTRSDLRVFAFTLGLAGLSVMVFGLIPGWRAMRVDPMASMKERAVLGSPRLGLGRILVAAQVAICLLLLVGAGLFSRTLINLRRIDTGFNTDNLLTFRIDAGQAGNDSRSRRIYTAILTCNTAKTVIRMIFKKKGEK